MKNTVSGSLVWSAVYHAPVAVEGDYILTLNRLQRLRSGLVCAIGSSQLIVSGDAGRTWRQIGGNIIAGKRVRAICEIGDEVIVLVSDPSQIGVFSVSKLHNSWELRSTFPGAVSLRACVSAEGVVMLAMSKGRRGFAFYYSRDSGRSWRKTLGGDYGGALTFLDAGVNGLCLVVNQGVSDDPSTLRVLDVIGGTVLTERVADCAVLSAMRISASGWMLGSDCGKVFRYRIDTDELDLEEDFGERDWDISAITGAPSNPYLFAETSETPPFVSMIRKGSRHDWIIHNTNLGVSIYDALLVDDSVLALDPLRIWRLGLDVPFLCHPALALG